MNINRLFILLLFIPLPAFSEVQIGAIPALIYENYDEPNLILDENGIEIDHTAISKVLTSLTTQFIWKDKRNILLLNLEFLGSMGSLEGSFGKDGKLEGQLKADTFYRGFYKESPFYIKFGKYPGSLPFGFGTIITTGQGELGYETDNLSIFYSSIFYNWFNTKKEDGSYEYKNEKYNDDNLLINLIGLNCKFYNNNLLLRIPIEYYESDIFNSFYPSVNHILKMDSITFNSFIGLAYRNEVTTLGFREEISFNYYKLQTKLLAAHLSGDDDIDKSYNYTSIDNKYLEFHYGTHFNYIYQQAGNIYGLNSIGMYQSWTKENIYIWASISSHFSVKSYTSENRDDSFIGSIFSAGLKWNNLWNENTLFEIYASLFKPEGFSIINDVQTRDLGFQLVIKLHHIIF